jgi:DNA-binding response OmpR family regulator
MSRGRARVLLVEDDELVSEMLCGVLEEYYDVVAVATPTEALAQLDAAQIDLLLLDYNLGGGTGGPVMQQAEACGVPMIWMTGDPDALKIAGFAHHAVLAKPFRIDDALLLVDRTFLAR